MILRQGPTILGLSGDDSLIIRRSRTTIDAGDGHATIETGAGDIIVTTCRGIQPSRIAAAA